MLNYRNYWNKTIGNTNQSENVLSFSSLCCYDYKTILKNCLKQQVKNFCLFFTLYASKS